MKRIPILFIAILAAACNKKFEPVDISQLIDTSLNSTALTEYSRPFRTDIAWNVNARKFTYAPYFDFSETELSSDEQKRVAGYRFTVYMNAKTATTYVAFNDFQSKFVNPGPGDTTSCRKWSFMANEPKADLSPIWNDIPFANVWLIVRAVDSNGRNIKEVGRRAFLHDKPFQLTSSAPARPYRDAAIRAQQYLNTMSGIANWEKGPSPDLNYAHNSYANKIIGETVAMEVRYAREVPEVKEKALKIANNAADFLIAQSRPKGTALEYFTPTYYGNNLKAGDKANQDATMTMDACYAAQAFLDLYDLTSEKKYYDHVLGMARTYAKIQLPDGSFYSKIKFSDGTPLTDAKAMLHPLLNFLVRLRNQYGLSEFVQLQEKCEKWMDEEALRTFDLRGQFEDVSVAGIEPYENLTNCTAAPYASYLLNKKSCSATDIANAKDLIRLSEDQFVYWDVLRKADGTKAVKTPCVFEQYHYPTPVDNSACNVANAFLDLYEKTGDRLAYFKAKALIDNITRVQDASTGMIPTTWDVRSNESGRTLWVNCSQADIKILLRMDQVEKPQLARPK